MDLYAKQGLKIEASHCCVTTEAALLTYNRTSATMELTSNTVSRSKPENSLPALTERHTDSKVKTMPTHQISLHVHMTYLNRKAVCSARSPVQYG